MTVKQAISQMRRYDRDFLIAIIIGLMCEENTPIHENDELSEINEIRMQNMKDLFESNPMK